MSAVYRKSGSDPGAEGERVVILRGARNGDPDYRDPTQVFVRFGDGGERAVAREELSDLVDQDLPPLPEEPVAGTA